MKAIWETRALRGVESSRVEEEEKEKERNELYNCLDCHTHARAHGWRFEQFFSVVLVEEVEEDDFCMRQVSQLLLVSRTSRGVPSSLSSLLGES